MPARIQVGLTLGIQLDPRIYIVTTQFYNLVCQHGVEDRASPEDPLRLQEKIEELPKEVLVSKATTGIAQSLQSGRRAT